jgi:heme oxygenase
MPLSLAARLRLETQQAHERVELSFDLTAAAARVDTYFAGLCKLKCAYLAIGAALDRLSCGVALEARQEVRIRIESLQDDIRAFNLSEPSFPRLEFMLEDASEALGCEYVIRGSALGGIVIFKLAATKLGITQQHGGRFFYGEGPETHQKWSNFWEFLSSLDGDNMRADRAVHGAIKTFDHFERALAVA